MVEDRSELTVSPPDLEFSTRQWDEPQTVNVTSAQDNIQDGNIDTKVDSLHAQQAGSLRHTLDAQDSRFRKFCVQNCLCFAGRLVGEDTV